VTVPASNNPHDAEFWSELGGAKKDDAEDDSHHGPKEHKTDAQVLKGYLLKDAESKVLKRIGVPWEQKDAGGVFERYWDTAIMAMNHPQEAFGTMFLRGGLGKPMTFLLLGVTFGAFFSALYGAIGNSISVFSAVQAAAESEGAAPLVTPVMIATIVGLFFATFFGSIIGWIIHAFLQAGLLQLAMPLVGIKDTNFESTFRVAAYCNGSIALCSIVPAIGFGFMLFLWFVGLINGIMHVYGATQGKAAMAVLLTFVPLLLPIVALVVIALGGAYMAATAG
jgi:hypothetical protein